MSEKKASQIFDSYWVYARRKKGGYPENTIRSGKWLIFVPFSEVDEWWDLIKICTEKGLLGHASKVATARPNPNTRDPNMKVICVYSYDSDDKQDVMRIRAELKKLGIIQKIPYKTDKATLEGKYSIQGHKNISKYYI